MKITKYPQSCFVLEKNSKRIIIDPGNFVAQSYAPEQLGKFEGILITHQHPDHADPGLITALTALNPCAVVANATVAEALGEGLVTRQISDGDAFDLAGFSIKAFNLMHGDMADGAPGPFNTGYIIDDVFFHPGDGIEVMNLTVPVAAVPIGGPDISPRDIYDFIKAIGAHTIIPMHYDYFKTDPDFIAAHGASIVPGVELRRLDNEQSIEL